MSSNLKVNSIVPATGNNVAIGTAGGTISYNASVSGISTFSNGISVGTGGTVIKTTASGLVGIGTAIPSKQITVGAAITTSQFQVSPHSAGWDIAVTSGDISPHYQGNFRLYTGQIGSGTERFKVSSEGYVTKPFQPSFRAGRNSNYTPGALTDIIFNVTNGSYHHNNGGHYEPSNGRFTAPVAGMYTFSVHVIWQSLADGQAMDDAFEITVNGSLAGYSFQRGEYVNGTTGNGGYYTDFGSYNIYLEANEYVAVRNRLGSLQVHGNQYYTTFSGALLG